MRTSAPARLTLVAALLLAMLLASGPTTASTPPADTAAPTARATEATLFAGGLAFPAAFTFAPDGHVFYGERLTGQIRTLDAAGNNDTLFFDVPDLVADGEQGLLGIALHPDYPTTPSVYVYATRNTGSGDKDQILRLTDNGGTGENMQVLYSINTLSGRYHDGGRILFGPDDMLYVVTGEGHSPRRAQNLKASAGKILRLTPSGAIPANNPSPDKPWFAYGVRNSFGFDFDPINGVLWESENGPSCNDELNRVPRGRNLGWGSNNSCGHPPATPRNTNQDGPKPVQPKLWYNPTIAPTGVAFCEGCGLESGEGRLYMGAWNTGEIRRMTLSADRKAVSTQTVVYTHPDGIMSIETAPDGSLYFSEPDGIYRLVDA